MRDIPLKIIVFDRSFFRAQINILIGFVIFAWFISPAAYYSNLWGSKAMPIISSRVFTADGYFYNVSAVLTPQLRLNETAYKNYGKIEMNRDRDSHELIGYSF